MGILSTVISHFSEGEQQPVRQILSEIELVRALEENGELSDFIDRVEDSVCGGDAAPLSKSIDQDSILQRATSGVAPDRNVDRIRAMFSRGTRSAWKQVPLAQDYMGKHFRFLRPRSLRGQEGLLFRMADEGGSLNYYLFIMGYDKGVGYRVRDIFVVGINETVSATLRRTFEHLIADLSSNHKGSEISSAFVDNLTQIARMNNAFRAKDFSSVLDIYEQLPVAAQKDHKVLLMRVEASENMDRDTLSAAMDDWAAAFPGERNLPLKYIDCYFATGKYDASARVIRSLEKELGGDSYLKFRLGEVLLAKEEIPAGVLPTWNRGTGRKMSGGRRSPRRAAE
jgi:hypothetical protein